MRIVKSVLIVLSFIVFIIVASCAHILVTFLRPQGRWHVMSYLGFCLIKFLRRLLGIRVQIRGNREVLNEKGNFIISRHVSYTDGLILGSLLPSILLSKDEIRRWPLIGLVTAISGTVFVDRQKKNKVAEPLEKMIELLKGRINVVVFPEGTSSDGTALKPFQAVFFQAPIAAYSPVVPVTISYVRCDGRRIDEANRGQIFWWGQVSFFEHLWNLLKFRRIDVTVTLHNKISTRHYDDTSLDRKQLCQYCFEYLNQAMGGRTEVVEARESEVLISHQN